MKKANQVSQGERMSQGNEKRKEKRTVGEKGHTEGR